MNGNYEEGLYGAIEKSLKEAGTAMTCADLWDAAEIKKLADSQNRVSDYLGNLWRRGDVLRVPAPPQKNSRARWAYAWKGRVHAKVTLADIAKGSVSVSEKISSVISRPHLEMTEDGGVITITTPHCTITIKPR